MINKLDIALTVAAALFLLGIATNTYLASRDAVTSQRLGQAQQYLQQHVPQARANLQTLALRVNASAPLSPALKQILDNLRLQVNPGPATSATTPVSGAPAFATGPAPTVQSANSQ